MLSRAPAAMAGWSRLVTSMGRRCSSAASPSARRPCHVHHLGLVPYLEALALQERVVHEKRKQRAEKDVLLLLEHPHVYTLGRGNGDEFLRFTPGESGAPDVVHTGRGGQVTYHEPGQLVAYPLLDLRHHKQDLHWYVRQVEEVLIRALRQFGVEGERSEGKTGVWVGMDKVAAIGIGASQWVTMHGFALNVCNDLTGFRRIVPCGIEGHGVCSLAQVAEGATMPAAQAAVEAAFEEVFGVRLVRGGGLPAAAGDAG